MMFLITSILILGALPCRGRTGTKSLIAIFKNFSSGRICVTIVIYLYCTTTNEKLIASKNKYRYCLVEYLLAECNPSIKKDQKKRSNINPLYADLFSVQRLYTYLIYYLDSGSPQPTAPPDGYFLSLI